ncbi:hypothetical protein ACOSQ3_024761 [Xanthoceras sorbifolium]
MPFLPKLQHLTLEISAANDISLFTLARFINKCPFLHKFTLKEVSKLWPYPKKKKKYVSVFSLRWWNLLDLLGIQLILILELAFHTMLEKMIVNPTSPLWMGSYFEF